MVVIMVYEHKAEGMVVCSEKYLSMVQKKQINTGRLCVWKFMTFLVIKNAR